MDLVRHVNPCQISVSAQGLIQQSDRSHARLTLLEQTEVVGILGRARLESKETFNDLQIVFHPMVKFPQQHFFFSEGGLYLVFDPLVPQREEGGHPNGRKAERPVRQGQPDARAWKQEKAEDGQD